jgi:hypothetical protein
LKRNSNLILKAKKKIRNLNNPKRARESKVKNNKNQCMSKAHSSLDWPKRRSSLMSQQVLSKEKSLKISFMTTNSKREHCPKKIKSEDL